MSGSLEDTLGLWSVSLRSVKDRIRPLFTPEIRRIAARMAHTLPPSSHGQCGDAPIKPRQGALISE